MAAKRATLTVVAAVFGLAIVPASAGAVWLAGDLHVHTTYSHDVYAVGEIPELNEVHTLGFPVAGQFALAASRGLDYLAITDHNDVRSQSDPGFGAQGVIPVPGYEASLRGHAQMLGARQVYDPGDSSTAAVQAMADALRADGGVFQANHPFGESENWTYGQAIRPDTIEVWNISRLYQPPFPSAADNDMAIRWWEEWLDRGDRVAATGGSDSHYVLTSPLQGVGQPTTWVWSRDRTPQGVLDGLRAGHTTISAQPPNLLGARVFVEADGDRNGSFESIVGDTVPPGSPLRVLVDRAPGARLRVITDGGQLAFRPRAVGRGRFVTYFTLPATATWVRAEVVLPDLQDQRRAGCDPIVGATTTYCRNQLLVLAMSSALYLRAA